MTKHQVQVSVAGQEYRLVTTLDEGTMRRLAQTVEARLQGLGPGQQLHPQALLLVALSLAHDLETERCEKERLTARSSAMLARLLDQVDSALGSVDEHGRPLPVRHGASRK